MYKTDTVGHDKKYKTTGQKSWDNNAGAGQLGQESLGSTARTGQLENVRKVQAGQEREDRMART
jgi:hypothetical protein